MNILVINPGSTSTKIAVYADQTAVFTVNIRHEPEQLAPFACITDQLSFRREVILQELNTRQIAFSFDAVIGRGGLLKPLPGGVYRINERMKHDAMDPNRQHASNLGCLLADEIASFSPGCLALIADPVVVDELDDIARISGLPMLPRLSIFHALNQKATARQYAKDEDVPYETLRLIVCHLGGGISVGVHRHGRIVEVNNALEGEGPFAPERSGTLPAGQLAELCFSGQYTHAEIRKMLAGRGGLFAHAGSTSVADLVEQAKQGDTQTELLLDAMVYQVARSIGAAATVLCGQIDAILLTGGIAYSTYIMSRLEKRIRFLAPIRLYPGENEMNALASNAWGALSGEFPVREYN